jgi:outer membrane protein OmpA-like peptidoglycan-associated protein
MSEIGLKLFDNSIYNCGDPGKLNGIDVTVTTIVDNQKTAEIELYHLEPGRKADSSPIGKITIRNLPPAKAGDPSIVIRLTREADKSLKAVARSKDNQELSSLRIPYAYWHPEASIVREDGKKQTSSVSDDKNMLTFTKKEQDFAPGKSPSTIAKEAAKAEEKKAPVGFLIAGVLILILILAGVFILTQFLKPAGQEGSLTGSLSPTVEPKPTDTIPPLAKATASPETAALATKAPEPTESSVEIDAVNAGLKEIGSIYFVPNSTELRAGSERTVEAAAALLKKYKGKIFLTLYGHTASYGSVQEQDELAYERAKTIYTALVKSGAIGSSFCDYKGMGSREPVTDMTDEAKIYLNRRVEIKARPN